MRQENQALHALLSAQGESLLKDWLAAAGPQGGSRSTAAVQAFGEEAASILSAVTSAVAADSDAAAFEQPAWQPLRAVLDDVSIAAAARGATAAQTSAFVMALKKPLFKRLEKASSSDVASFSQAVQTVSLLVDQMAQTALSTYQDARENVIRRQQEELLELSTPVIKLWDGVLAAPLIGTLDSSRTQTVMETLLQKIVDTGSEVAIIDITGVPTVDTMVAQHLLKTVTAIRLMGAESIVSGIRPQIAQTIVHLGIDLQGVTTKATLADALALAMKKTGHTVARTAKA